MDNINTKLVRELSLAEKIILIMLKHMNTAQKAAAGFEIEEAGLAGDGMTRYHERRAVLDAATEVDEAGTPVGEAQPHALELWAINTVADKTGLTPREIVTLTRTDKFPQPTRGSTAKGWPARGVLAWIEENKRTAEAPPVFCKDCKHYNPARFAPVCMAPGAHALDLVHGHQRSLCSVMRTNRGRACGPTGELFESTPTVTDEPSPVERYMAMLPDIYCPIDFSDCVPTPATFDCEAAPTQPPTFPVSALPSDRTAG